MRGDLIEIMRRESELEAWRRAREELRRRRAKKAEPAIPRVVPLDRAEEAGPLPEDMRELEAEIQRLGAELASRDLEMGRLARRLLAMRGWSWLGYASPRQYAEERVGVSLSSLRHRALLARRCDDLPEVGLALEAGLFGYEAALLHAAGCDPASLEVSGARGGDEDENLVSLCSWCHLHGIHGGRIRATPPASHIRWVFGQQPILMVDGRERRRLGMGTGTSATGHGSWQ